MKGRTTSFNISMPMRELDEIIRSFINSIMKKSNHFILLFGFRRERAEIEVSQYTHELHNKERYIMKLGKEIEFIHTSILELQKFLEGLYNAVLYILHRLSSIELC